MAGIHENRILAKLLDPISECFTADVAARIAALRAGSRTEQRVGQLALKNSVGTLTPQEESEYSAYVEAFDVIAILQAKARKAIRLAGPVG